MAVATLWVSAALPLGAQQQGPINPQVPAALPEAPGDSSAGNSGAKGDASPIAPGTPARTEHLTREGAPLLGLPSWLERTSAGASPAYATPPVLPVDVPERVTISAGTRIPIVLETSLSSRFSRKGQPVVFRTTRAVPLGESLQVPPGVEIRGRVAEVRRPGAFGKSGTLRVTVERMVLPGAAATRLRAQLRSGDVGTRGRLSREGRRGMDSQGLVMLSMQGALAGAPFGGKAAGIGAGAGAAVAAVLMMSKKGHDISVERGTPFSVRLQQDAELSAAAIYWAQQDYSSRHPGGTSFDHDGEEDDTRPVLKRRPVPPAAEQAPEP
jgi:hypothetical protein